MWIMSCQTQLLAIPICCLSASLSDATKHLQCRALCEFRALGCDSTSSADLCGPASTFHTLKFILALYHRGLASSSFRTRLSAISFWNNIHGWTNPINHFFMYKCLIGLSNSSPPYHPCRMLVTPALLRTICDSLPSLFSTPYEVILYRVVFLLTFFAFLRVSEYTSHHHVLCREDIPLLSSALKLSFSSFKFSAQ